MCASIILVRFGLLSGQLLVKSCLLSLPYVPFLFLLFVTLVISCLGFKRGIWILIYPVPGHRILFTFKPS